MQWLAHQRLGYNYRLNEMSAALGVAQVRRLDEILEKRRRVAQAYIERLMTNRYLILPTLLEETRMSWFVFAVRLNDLFEPGDRDDIMRELRAEGIGCECYFPPIHLQPYIAKQFGYNAGDFPVTEYVSARTLGLAVFHTNDSRPSASGLRCAGADSGKDDDGARGGSKSKTSLRRPGVWPAGAMERSDPVRRRRINFFEFAIIPPASVPGLKSCALDMQTKLVCLCAVVDVCFTDAG